MAGTKSQLQPYIRHLNWDPSPVLKLYSISSVEAARAAASAEETEEIYYGQIGECFLVAQTDKDVDPVAFHR